MTQTLQPLDLIRPGSKGLNLQETGNEDPGFCVLATNCIIDGSGRLAARNGWAATHSGILTTGFSASGSNQFTAPRDFTDVAWTASNLTASLAAPGIDGITNTGSVLTDATAAGVGNIYEDITIPNDSNYNTFSLFVRKDSITTRFPEFQCYYSGGTAQLCYFQLNTSTGAIAVRTSVGTYNLSVDEETDYWRVKLDLLNNSTGNTTFRAIIAPCYSATLGGTSDNTLTGSITVDYAETLLGTQTHSTQALTDLTISAIGEHISAAGVETLIFSGNNNLFSGSTTIANVTGTITTPTADDWQFLNFNNKIIGIQDNHNPIVGTGGAFADVTNASTAGTMPTGPAGLAAFGRVWMVASSSDKTLIRYSDTLDETTWDDDTTPGAAGQLDMKGVIGWGQDTIEALAEFNGHLVVFGKHNIAIYRNPWNPNNNSGSTQAYETFELADLIQGVGCISRDTVKSIGTDLLFMSDQGLMSLGRLLVQKSAPISEVSRNIHDDLITNSGAETDTTLKAEFHDTERWYILVLKNSSIMYCFDTKSPLPDGSLRVTKWTGIDPTAIFHSRDDSMYFGQSGTPATYSTYLDNASTYEYYYKSSWQTLETDRTKLPKKWEILAEGGADYNVSLRAFFDYNSTFSGETITVPSSTGVAEWGVSEWSVAEWSGSGSFNNLKGWGKGAGRVISLGVNTTINGSDFALQRLLIMLKLGRKP